MSISLSNFTNGLARLYGGAMLVKNCALSIQDSLFRDNIAYAQGGAMFVSSDSILLCMNTVFERNRALLGGALYFVQGVFEIINSTFKSNSMIDLPDFSVSENLCISSNRIGFGGAIYLFLDSVRYNYSMFTDVTIMRNFANVGSGIYIDGDFIDSSKKIFTDLSKIILKESFASSTDPEIMTAPAKLLVDVSDAPACQEIVRPDKLIPQKIFCSIFYGDQLSFQVKIVDLFKSLLSKSVDDILICSNVVNISDSTSILRSECGWPSNGTLFQKFVFLSKSESFDQSLTTISIASEKNIIPVTLEILAIPCGVGKELAVSSYGMYSCMLTSSLLGSKYTYIALLFFESLILLATGIYAYRKRKYFFIGSLFSRELKLLIFFGCCFTLGIQAIMVSESESYNRFSCLLFLTWREITLVFVLSSFSSAL
jgi:hypothetical protein